MKYFLVLLLVALSEQQSLFRFLTTTINSAACTARMSAVNTAADLTGVTKNAALQARDNAQTEVNANPNSTALSVELGLARTAFLTATFADVEALKAVRSADQDCNGGANHLQIQAKIDNDLGQIRVQTEQQINEELAAYNATDNPIKKEAALVEVRALSSLLVAGLRSDANDIQNRLNHPSGRSADEIASLETRLNLTNQFVDEYLPYTTFNGTVTPLPLQ